MNVEWWTATTTLRKRRRKKTSQASTSTHFPVLVAVLFVILLLSVYYTFAAIVFAIRCHSSQWRWWWWCRCRSSAISIQSKWSRRAVDDLYINIHIHSWVYLLLCSYNNSHSRTQFYTRWNSQRISTRYTSTCREGISTARASFICMNKIQIMLRQTWVVNVVKENTNTILLWGVRRKCRKAQRTIIFIWIFHGPW